MQQSKALRFWKKVIPAVTEKLLPHKTFPDLIEKNNL